MKFEQLLVGWARHNDNFRRVVYTMPREQWVLMCIPPGGEIGKEKHRHVRQSFFFVSGSGVAMIDDQQLAVRSGSIVIVPPGTTHNFVNTGKRPLRLYTTYEPPNHIDGRVQATKRAADRDVADEAFGRRADRKKR